MTITIELTKGQVTLIDDEDGDLATVKWRANPVGRNEYYVRGHKPKTRSSIYLHRIILERIVGRPLAKTELVDHINGNPLDNRRENLRLATQAENLRNRGRQSNNSSGFKGVCWHRQAGKWQAQIMMQGKRTHLGLFTTPEEAHEAYCAAARKLHGEFANNGFNLVALGGV